MLVRGVERWIGSNWNVRLIRDIFIPRENLADSDVAWVHFRGVVRAPKEDSKNIRRRNVLLEYAIEHRVALWLTVERGKDSGTRTRPKAKEARDGRRIRCWRDLNCRENK